MKTTFERVSLALTEASVNSPVRADRAPKVRRVALINSDNPLAPTLKAEQIVRAARVAAPTPPSRPVAARPNLYRSSTPPTAPPSKFKRFLLAVGAAVGSLGVVGGFMSIIIFGPIGLAVAGGAAALAAGMIWLGSKVK